MKRKIYYLYLVVICSLVLGAYLYRTDQTKKNITTIDYEELQSLESDDRFAIVYVGRDNCEDCRRYSKTLFSTMYERGIHLYYFDTKAARKDPDFQQQIEALELTKVPALYIVGRDEHLPVNTKAIENGELDTLILNYQLKR